MYNDCASLSLKNKIKSSICCFRIPPDQLESLEYHQPRTPRSPRSPYAWLKSQSLELLEPKDWRRGLFGRVCTTAKSRKPYNSADFSYDPMSYSLNFEDDRTRDDEPVYSFSSRLPTSPERSSMPREIIAYV
ncbi:hypothetical protein Pint_12465 [Pistacia integerrima]|uniref:Uncharacterized protein n=1 Tax=Pistacia integerrima TaxID=434235 RepID=A0ACC0Y7W4_9ROSI|nr:hypothetical protein Pint_12465 [Pistacia integerrima]